MSQYEYSPWQWLLPFLRGGYRLPESDVKPGMRALDRTRVTSLSPAPWGDDPKSAAVANDRIALPRPWRTGKAQGGRWMQLAHPDRKVRFSVKNVYSQQTVSHFVSAPLSGAFAIEQNPRPLWSMLASNYYDRHIVLVRPDGGSEELIGVSNLGHWASIGYGLWGADGALMDGRGVTWNKNAMARRMLVRGETDHRLSITIRGSDLDTPHFPWANQWLALDPAKAPTPSNAEQAALLQQMIEYGVVVDDHGGQTNISYSEGRQWGGTTLHQLDIRLSMFGLAE